MLAWIYSTTFNGAQDHLYTRHRNGADTLDPLMDVKLTDAIHFLWRAGDLASSLSCIALIWESFWPSHHVNNRPSKTPDATLLDFTFSALFWKSAWEIKLSIIVIMWTLFLSFYRSKWLYVIMSLFQTIHLKILQNQLFIVCHIVYISCQC